ncbi:MAG: UbiD family decarboxylase [Gammaproteobacteria bacterium]|jgi:2,5-furandicarboxylate decarboxylase 1|nr:UbiD family decarboxylase [Gammaproteobacteria bacterium]
MAITDLRQFIQLLEKENDLLRISDEVDLKFDISGYIRNTSDVEGPALLFENVKGYSMPVVGGLFSSRRLMLKAMETTEEDAVIHYQNAMKNLSEPQLVNSGPCKEVIKLGAQASLSDFPIPIHSELDSGPFITAGVAISKDIEDGGKNASIYRFEQQAERQLGVLSPIPHHLGLHYQKAEALGKPLEVAIAIGVSPAVLICTQWEAAYGVNELTLAGALQGQPLEVVKCETVDLEVPASAEIIIEGLMYPEKRQMEGPFGEFTGYYTSAYPKPFLEISAITHRKDAIFQTALTGLPTTDNHVLKMIPMEASCYAFLKQRFPGVNKVHFHGAGGVGLLAVVSIKQHTKYEARNMLATMISAQGTKLVIAVDEDVDVFDMDKVMWAVCTRSQADKDLIVLPRTAAFQLDPSVPEVGVTTTMGIDATKPYGEEFEEVTTIPGAEKLPDILKLWKK